MLMGIPPGSFLQVHLWDIPLSSETASVTECPALRASEHAARDKQSWHHWLKGATVIDSRLKSVLWIIAFSTACLGHCLDHRGTRHKAWQRAFYLGSGLAVPQVNGQWLHTVHAELRSLTRRGLSHSRL